MKIPGVVRLGLELAFFGFATWALADLGQPELAAGFGAATPVHLGISWDRIVWLVQQ